MLFNSIEFANFFTISVVNVSIDIQLVNELERFAESCYNDDVRLVFVKYPMCYPIVERVSNLNVSDSIIETIEDRYSIPVLDYYYSDITKDTTNYYSFGHLNKKGSKLFTNDLCLDLDSLGIFKGI